MNKDQSPVLSLLADSTADVKKTNVFGYARIDIWCFNFDGKGTALVTWDDDAEFSALGSDDLHAILCGDAESGTRWYRRTSRE
jgi:hypothetical protein